MNGLSDNEKQHMIEVMMARRKELGITRAELALKTGISQQHIRKLEKKINTAYMNDYLMMADVVALEIMKRDLKLND
ncbi:hypothetical protein JCM19046_1614 [Bacillus sp. JCM 19046]|uniref:Transcriptional regulator n=1 Tax=Shouchella xiaoxiensis TaxID=766895 RepID=A0ABS2SPM7_9BACI|nr:putative transcriptional regulator [Shouchella xiaoxiensis]GAF11124.1 hypothetical protein JCM19045_199 [Bacillus sp. JCM 19045]GAF17131.1 hypothetical protein JCM19046_1614 [Bacillus sp. JCM 19046]